MPKQIVYEHNAREQLLRGIDKVANAVAITLGPKGRNVAIDHHFGIPTVTHDSVTVANDIALPDAFQNMGAQLLKEAASKTNDVAGDGHDHSYDSGPGDGSRRDAESGSRRQRHADEKGHHGGCGSRFRSHPGTVCAREYARYDSSSRQCLRSGCGNW